MPICAGSCSGKSALEPGLGRPFDDQADLVAVVRLEHLGQALRVVGCRGEAGDAVGIVVDADHHGQAARKSSGRSGGDGKPAKANAGREGGDALPLVNGFPP